MRATTSALWAEQDRHPGDRHRLFAAVARALVAETVLYPGSWCDVAASFVWPSVTYVDTDRRAARFFDDADGVREIVARHVDGAAAPEIRFLHEDYAGPLPLEEQDFDLLVSLYTGPMIRHCTRYLRVGGTLLANPSHGDVAWASIDPRYELAGVVTTREGRYRVTDADLDSYLVPTTSVDVTHELVERTGRGVRYTRSPFAYLFRRIR